MYDTESINSFRNYYTNYLWQYYCISDIVFLWNESYAES